VYRLKSRSADIAVTLLGPLSSRPGARLFSNLIAHSAVARTLYTVLLCLALVVLATMWLSPGLAQELIEMARVRMQSPDGSASAPQFGAGSYPLLPSNIPGSNLPGAPVQPMPASRPASWPGGTGETSAPVYNPVRATSQQGNPMPAFAPQANSMPVVSPPPSSMPVITPPPASMPVMQPAQAGQIGQYQPPPVQSPAIAAGQVPSQYAQSYPQTLYPQTPYPPYQPSQLTAAGPTAPASAPPLTGTATMSGPGYSPAIPPGGEAAPSPTPNMQNLQVLPTQPEEFKDAQVVARVGSEVILASDRDAYVAEFIESHNIQIPPAQMDEALKILNRQILKQMIDAKLVYNDAIHTIPKEGITQITANINKDFDKEQLPDLLKANSAASPQELDQKLRAKGSSLDRARRVYIEKKLMYGWIGQQVKSDEQVPLASILGYYEEHLENYKFAAQARWEELMVSYDHFPDEQSALTTLAEMGNQVMQGASFAEVAKARSQGPTAPDGGAYDWTNQGSLGTKELDQAIFGPSLPLNALSEMIKAKNGAHIIRVLERKPGGKKSFEDAQGEIKKKIKDENREKQVNKFLDDLRKKTQVWTIYDDQPGGIDGPKKPS
jgi:parvulin-like peptidyl-prolyl isomerase